MTADPSVSLKSQEKNTVTSPAAFVNAARRRSRWQRMAIGNSNEGGLDKVFGLARKKTESKAG